MSSTTRTIDQISHSIREGKRISQADAITLWNEGTYPTLAQLAHEIRLTQNPADTVTYLVDRNINYTNVCNSDCSFCAFYRHDPKDPESYVLNREVLSSKIEEALSLGASRILLQGGHNDELPYSFYRDLISWIHNTYKIQLNAFSPSEIHQMTLVSGMTAEEVLTDLQQCGLYGLPGGGAEILDDAIRQRISPKKIRTDRWLEIMGIAQRLGLVTSATMVIGFGETIEHRWNHLERLRELQDAANQSGVSGFNLFVMWTHQFNERTSLGRSRHAARYGVSAVEYLKHVAWCRIILDNIQHHQASWPTLGAEIAQIGLYSGCDDIGSTMMEENVVSQAGAPTSKKWAMSPQELRSIIEQAGFTPRERDSSFAFVESLKQSA
jgi:cyclic dehypoxanthinyl futalosine synthase